MYILLRQDIDSICSQGIYPLKDVFIRKVKLLKAPKFDISKLNEAHEGAEDTGRKVSA